MPLAHARVTGVCSNCHTMHYSQDGGQLSSWGSNGPYRQLLVNSCAGCHTNTQNGDTIVTIGPAGGQSRIPIVYNSAVEPSQPLAGGNFYWLVKNGDDTLGHNVLEISGMNQDSYLTTAPGGPVSGGQCTVCHDKVKYCRSCHTPQHHKNDHPGGNYLNVVGYGSTVGAYYRFLGPAKLNSKIVEDDNGSPINIDFHDNPGVKGIEDPNWEQNPDSTHHNEYMGETSDTTTFVGGYQSISDFCGGCHARFHRWDWNVESPGSSPWFLHPTDAELPSDTNKEYYLYNTQDGINTGPYNPQAPVCRPDIDSFDGVGPSDTVRPGTDQVHCLSCHRPHGTPYSDILRWNYSQQIAGGGGADGTGCFVCHTKKDE